MLLGRAEATFWAVPFAEFKIVLFLDAIWYNNKVQRTILCQEANCLGTYILAKDNLGIRKAVFADCELFAIWETKQSIRQSFSISQNHSYEDVLREYFAKENDPATMQLTMADRKNDDLPIGRIEISHIDRAVHSADIRRIYIGNEAYLRQGYAHQAMGLLLAYLFDGLNMERVTLNHYLYNQKAAGLYKKLGFQYEGIQRHVTMRDNQFYDLYLMSMLKEDYLASLP